MIDSTKIDELIVAARARDQAVTAKLLDECARLPVMAPYQDHVRTFSLDALNVQLKPGRFGDSGLPGGTSRANTPIENGSYAYQLYSAICFVIDARAELKLLELIASPTFYDAIMRSAAEKKD